MIQMSMTTVTDYRSIAVQAANSVGIDPNIFVAQIQQESGFNPNAKSPAGAEGIAQFMPGTAAGLGVNPWDPTSSLYAAARLDKRNLSAYGGDWPKALAAYNAGGGAVNGWISKWGSNWLSHAFAETQNYVKSIMANAGKTNFSSGNTTQQTTQTTNTQGGSSTDTSTTAPSTGIIQGLLGVSASGFEQFMIAIFAGLVIVIGLFTVFRKKVSS